MIAVVILVVPVYIVPRSRIGLPDVFPGWVWGFFIFLLSIPLLSMQLKGKADLDRQRRKSRTMR